MADDTFEIGIEVTGEGAAAQAFENLKLREMEAREEASSLAAALRELKSSGEATDAQIEEQARALTRAKQAASQYAAEARNAQRAQSAQESAQRSATAASNANAQAQTAQAVSAMAYAQRVGAIAQSLQQFGGIINQINPKLGQLGEGLNRVGQMAGAGAAAFGPWGAVIGGAIGGIEALVLHLHEEEEAHRRAAEAARAQATDIDALMAGIRNQDTMDRLISGLGTVAEQTRAWEDADLRLRGEQQNLRERTNDLNEALAERRRIEGLLSGAVIGSTDQTRRLEQQYAAVQRRIRGLNADVRGFTVSMQTQQETTIALAVALQQAETRQSDIEREDQRRQRARQASQQRQRDYAAEIDTMIRLANEQYEHEIEQQRRAKEAENNAELYREQLMNQRGNALRELYAFWTQLDNDAIDHQIENLDRLREKQIQATEESKAAQIDKADQAKQHLVEAGQITESMWSNIGGTVMDGVGQMVDFIAKGGDLGSKAFQQLLHSFLQATSVQYTIKALAEGAEAVMALARQDYPSAAQHGIAAGMAVAVVAATGIGAAVTAPSASGGGAPPAAGSAAGGAGGGGSTQHITIQLYAPNAVMTQAEQGALIATSMREARRQLGPGAVRS